MNKDYRNLPGVPIVNEVEGNNDEDSRGTFRPPDRHEGRLDGPPADPAPEPPQPRGTQGSDPSPIASTPVRSQLVSDAERDSASILLRDHFAAGRLTFEELAERLQIGLEARNRADLEVCLRDLPLHKTAQTTWPVKTKPHISAVFGEVVRKGNWALERHTLVKSIFGSVSLDLRDAIFDTDGVTIEAVAIFGEIQIKVPEGTNLSVEGRPVFGSFSVSGAQGSVLPGLPTVAVTGKAIFGEVSVKVVGNRRSGGN